MRQSSARAFFETYTKDFTKEDLGKLFTSETPEAYRFFARGINTAELDVALRLLSYGDPVQLLDHAQAIVITRGPQGASLYRPRKKPLHVPAFHVQGVDPTGAGDAFRAGWYAALRAGHPFDEALRWGDDYQLLFTLPRGIEPPLAAHRIGEVRARSDAAVLLDGAPLADTGLGYEHR